MTTVLLIIHTLIAAALVGLILLQKSEGGALGMGGGPGSFMTGRGAANVLTRSTTILGAAFFLTSISLSILAAMGNERSSVIFEDAQNSDVLQAPIAPQPLDMNEAIDLPPLSAPGEPAGDPAGESQESVEVDPRTTPN
jgi:preprotein translocase subunit SecG